LRSLELAREHRAAQVKRAFNLEPQSFKYSEEMLALKDIDGVMIATGDFQHAKLCAEVVKAGKDCYVEKPFANVLSEAIETRDIVKQSKQIVQMGTQHRSQPYPLAVRDIIRSGRIGDIVHIEQEWNVNEERWRFTPMDTGYNKEMLMDTNMEWKQWLYGRTSQLKEEDTDWKRWLLGKPHRPFDPHVYLEFRLYKDFSSGLFDQWLSHACDLVHLWTGETYPESVVANGGIFAWKDGPRKSQIHASLQSSIQRVFSTPISRYLETAIAAFRGSMDEQAPSKTMVVKVLLFLR
jgi:predicted dehydrogenase